MRGPLSFLLVAATATLGGGACGNKGAVTFAIRSPSAKSLNPLSDKLSEISLKRADGSLVGVASQSASSPETLNLGPLAQIMMPADLEMVLSSGSDLLGKARVKDVTILNGVQKEYVAEVRKPLVTIGFAMPEESIPGNSARPGQIEDPATSLDLALSGTPRLPQPTTAATTTWDGRFILAGGTGGVTVIDTGSGQTVGVAALTFAPSRLATGTRDSAAVALDPAGGVAIFSDVAALTGNPAGTQASVVSIAGALPRTATFSADGQRIYVLTGGVTPTDPCTAITAPPPNSVVVLGLDGALLGTWTLPGFATDLTVDPASGKIVISDTTNKQVATLDLMAEFGTATLTKLFDAMCPSALRVANGDVFVVTAARATGFANAFKLIRAPIAGGMATDLAYRTPSYTLETGDMPTPDGSTLLAFQLTPISIAAYEMAITPDASRAVFATKARYREKMQPIEVFRNPCTADFDIVEYGLFKLDTGTGQATYQPRSRIVATPTGRKNCIVCTIDTFGGPVDIIFPCDSSPGDRAAGISAVFGAQ
jgi:hypothetical protein